MSHGKWHYLYTTYKTIEVVKGLTSIVPSQNICQRSVKYWSHVQRRGDFLIEYTCTGYGISNSGGLQPGVYTMDVYYGSVDWLTSGKSGGTYEQGKAFDISPLLGEGVGTCG